MPCTCSSRRTCRWAQQRRLGGQAGTPRLTSTVLPPPHLQEQSRSRGPRLDALEAEVRHLRQQLCDLQGTRAEAQAARNTARVREGAVSALPWAQGALPPTLIPVPGSCPPLPLALPAPFRYSLPPSAPQEQLAVQEEEAMRGRQNREQALAELRRQAEERRAQTERPERRVRTCCILRT